MARLVEELDNGGSSAISSFTIYVDYDIYLGELLL